MSFTYTPQLIASGFTYPAYKQHLHDTLDNPPVDDAAAKLRPHVEANTTLMDGYDQSYVVSDSLMEAINAAPGSTWLVITEGWCSDAAFSVPMMAAIERALPGKVQVRIFLRDSNLNLIDANLTDGVRSIPKLVVLDKDLQERASWGPRPAALTTLVTAWKEEGLTLQQLIRKLHAWYNEDATKSIQEELELMLAALPAERM